MKLKNTATIIILILLLATMSACTSDEEQSRQARLQELAKNPEPLISLSRKWKLDQR